MDNEDSKAYKDSFTLVKRNGGCGVIVNGKLYVWGGEGDRVKLGFEFLRNDPNFRDIKECVSYPEPEPKQENNEYYYCTIDEYDLSEGLWRHRMTHANSLDDFPLFGRGCNMAEIHGNLYAFAGFNPKIVRLDDGTRQRQGVFANTIHCLNMETFEWKKLKVVDNIHVPPPLYLCGTLSYDGKFCVFGGMIRKERQQPDDEEARTASHLQEGAECQQYGNVNDKFWTNEYFEFDINRLEWSAPVVKNRPSPCGVITFTRISDHHATVFAGNYQIARSDDLYIFDLKHKEFTSTLKPDYPTKWPPKLTFHTATCLVNPGVVNESLVPGRPPLIQKLLVVWGKDGDQSINNDMWLLEIDINDYSSLKWKKLPPQANIQPPTAWHIAQACYTDGIQACSVVVFGGNAYVNKTLPGSPRIAVSNLKIFEFGVSTLKQLCLAAVHPIISRYDLCQLDHQRRKQIEGYSRQVKCNNTFQMASIPLL